MAASDVAHFEDLIDLQTAGDGHDWEWLAYALDERYKRGKVYTHCGTSLLSINPLRELQLFTDEHIRQYNAQTAPPVLGAHLYAVPQTALRQLAMRGRPQAVIVRGESGAGKSVAVRECMRYLTTLAGDAESTTRVRQLDNILNAFGCAATPANADSSRCARWTQLFFDRNTRICGVASTVFLFERQRVTQRSALVSSAASAAGNSSFHICYRLFGAPPDLQRQAGVAGTSSRDWSYLADVDAGADGRAAVQAAAMPDTLRAMAEVGLSPAQIGLVARTVGAVLHIGQLQFVEDAAAGTTAGSCGSGGRLAVADSEWLMRTAALLGVQPPVLLHALTSQTVVCYGRRERQQLGLLDAPVRRDELARSLYASLFRWLVTAIQWEPATCARSIGFLDLAGFDLGGSAASSFDRFCRNYANEKIQQYCIWQSCKRQQDTYRAESIRYEYADFHDNLAVVDLLEAPSSGIIACVEAFAANGGVDGAHLLSQMTHAVSHSAARQQFAARSPGAGAASRMNGGAGAGFIVCHYAGDADYDLDGFVASNAARTAADWVVRLLAESSEPLLAGLFADDAAAMPAALLRDAQAPADMDAWRAKYDNNNGRCSMPRASMSRASLSDIVEDARPAPSRLGELRSVLGALTSELTQCEPHYIRCLLPAAGAAEAFTVSPAAAQFDSTDQDFVIHALQHGGEFEALRVRKIGFSDEMTHAEFWSQYGVLLPSSEWHMRPASGCSALSRYLATTLDSAAVEFKDVQMGRTRMFLRGTARTGYRQQLYVRYDSAATVIQCAFYCYKARCRVRLFSDCDTACKGALLSGDRQRQKLAFEAAAASGIAEMLQSARQCRRLAAGGAQTVVAAAGDGNLINMLLSPKVTFSQSYVSEFYMQCMKFRGRYALAQCPFLRPEDDACYARLGPAARRRRLLFDAELHSLPASLMRWTTENCGGREQRAWANTESRALFSLVLEATETTSGGVPSAAACALLARGVAHPGLRNEIYCQLMKQTSRCSDAGRLEKGWRLLYLCLRHFPPGRDLAPYLLSHVTQAARETVTRYELVGWINVECIASHCIFAWRDSERNCRQRAVYQQEPDPAAVRVFLEEEEEQDWMIEIFKSAQSVAAAGGKKDVNVFVDASKQCVVDGVGSAVADGVVGSTLPANGGHNILGHAEDMAVRDMIKPDIPSRRTASSGAVSVTGAVAMNGPAPVPLPHRKLDAPGAGPALRSPSPGRGLPSSGGGVYTGVIAGDAPAAPPPRGGRSATTSGSTGGSGDARDGSSVLSAASSAAAASEVTTAPPSGTGGTGAYRGRSAGEGPRAGAVAAMAAKLAASAASANPTTSATAPLARAGARRLFPVVGAGSSTPARSAAQPTPVLGSAPRRPPPGLGSRPQQSVALLPGVAARPIFSPGTEPRVPPRSGESSLGGNLGSRGVGVFGAGGGVTASHARTGSVGAASSVGAARGDAGGVPARAFGNSLPLR